MTPYSVLVAAPTYIGKDYALDAYLAAYEAFTFPHRRLLLVDNTRDEGEYAQHLLDLNAPVRRVEPSRDFEETFTRCWRTILEEAVAGEFTWVLSLESDVIGPPNLIDTLLNCASYCAAPFVTHCYPYHDGRSDEMYQGLGCVLLTTELLAKAMELCLDPEFAGHGLPEAAIFEAARNQSHISLATLLDIKHLDSPGGGSTTYWQYDEIDDPRVVKV